MGIHVQEGGGGGVGSDRCMCEGEGEYEGEAAHRRMLGRRVYEWMVTVCGEWMVTVW